MVQKTRRELQRIFKTGAKPSSEDFKDFIESTLNITDDGLEKSPGANSPLRISAQGSTEKLLDFYVDDIKTWSIDQRLNENSPGFNLCNASGSKLFIADSNGNVGINTSSPTAKLQIQQTGNEDALRINDESGDNSPLIVKGDGKVGIGTDTPAAKLQIQQTGSDDALRINDSANDSTPLIVKSDGKVGIGTTNPTALLQVEQTGSEDALRINDSANDSTPLIVKSDGKVGIGEANPASTLDINGSLQLQSGAGVNEFSIDGTLAGNSDLAIPTEKAVKTYADTKALLGGSSSQSFSANNLTVNGNVGIGTTSPGAKLQINGDLKLQSGVPVNEFSIDGTLAGNSDLVIPTEKAVRSYVTNSINSQDIPTIDFQKHTWSFSNRRGGRKTITLTFNFNHPILKGYAISAGWNLWYTDHETLKDIGIRVTTTCSGSTLTATLICYFKDDSGEHDDSYNGSGEVVAIAMLNK